jgi:AcrR family transcriptional regulator
VDVLLEAAARVLLARGYSAATTNRIAETAGVSVGTLYEYFENKNQLFEALIQREVGLIVAEVSSLPFDEGASVAEEIRALSFAAMKAVRYGPELFWALEHVPDAALRRSRNSARAVLIEKVREVLARHESELRVRDIRRAALLVVSAAEGIAINASNAEFDEQLAEEFITMLHSYLT